MEKQQAYSQPWINSALSDTIFILIPPFFALLLIALFPVQFKTSDEMPIIYWLILIVFIDVAHVYSTLYKTYFNPVTYKSQQSLLITIPVLCYISGAILYSINDILFWRVLAYLAVFHFIRQQYGFMRLYSRFETKTKWISLIDSITIYSATLYPILYWHLNPGRNFHWFLDGDFWQYPSEGLSYLSFIIYIIILGVYFIKEIYLYLKHRNFNYPRNLLILGTTLSWYFGIVYFNGDMVFTTLNVISHGIPYMALIWFFEKDKQTNSHNPSTKFLKLSFSKYGVFIFIITISIFAYLEEGLWDGLIWRENANLFSAFSFLPKIDSKNLLALIVPLLALPQATHYVLDGFIWRKQRTKT